jgi:hypothetical protein
VATVKSAEVEKIAGTIAALAAANAPI